MWLALLANLGLLSTQNCCLAEAAMVAALGDKEWLLMHTDDLCMFEQKLWEMLVGPAPLAFLEACVWQRRASPASAFQSMAYVYFALQSSDWQEILADLRYMSPDRVQIRHRNTSGGQSLASSPAEACFAPRIAVLSFLCGMSSCWLSGPVAPFC